MAEKGLAEGFARVPADPRGGNLCDFEDRVCAGAG